MKGLSHLDRVVLALFLVWITVGLIVTLSDLSPESLRYQPLPGFLRSFFLGCLHYGDAVLMLLAAMNTHLMASRRWGVRVARNWAMIVLVVSGLVETIGTLTGFPFGGYQYTENFGPRLGGILPLAIPVAWYVLLSNALLLLRGLPPLRAVGLTGRWPQALAAALLVTGLDWLMEPFAVHIKAYWFWQTSVVPWQNYLSWLVLSLLLLGLAAPSSKAQIMNDDPRPWIILGSMTILFASARLLHGL